MRYDGDSAFLIPNLRAVFKGTDDLSGQITKL
jgi:hypothetical protein